MWKKNDPTPCLLRLLSHHSLHVARILLQKYSELTDFGLSRPFTQTIPHAPHTTVSVNFFFRRDCASTRGLGLSVLYQPLLLSFSNWMGVSSNVKMLLKFLLSFYISDKVPMKRKFYSMHHLFQFLSCLFPPIFLSLFALDSALYF